MAELIRHSLFSPDELRILSEIRNRVEKHRPYNRRRTAYYEAHRTVQDLGVALPPQLRNTTVALGWPGQVIDSMDERLNFNGLVLPDADIAEFGVLDIFQDNELELTWQESHIEALIHGVAFEATSLGDVTDGEPEVLITIESPGTMSGIWNPRRRALAAAGSFTMSEKDGEPDQAVAVSLYLPDQTIKAQKAEGGKWVLTDRQEHDLGRVMVRRLVNRSWSSRQWGRSEITRPIIYYTDAAMRTLLGAEVAREFYGSPQRYILGADEKAFQDASGKSMSAWRAYMGRFLALTANEDSEKLPEVGQFDGNSPDPYIGLVKMYAQLVAGESGIPAPYFGFVHENPSSADAIRASENRHVKRAERRQATFGFAHRGAILDGVLLRDGKIPEELRRLDVKWRDASTPTRAATADAAVKLAGADILPAGGDVILEQIGLDEVDIARVKQDRKAAAGNDLAALLRANAAAAASQNPNVRELASRTAEVGAS